MTSRRRHRSGLNVSPGTTPMYPKPIFRGVAVDNGSHPTAGRDLPAVRRLYPRVVVLQKAVDPPPIKCDMNRRKICNACRVPAAQVNLDLPELMMGPLEARLARLNPPKEFVSSVNRPSASRTVVGHAVGGEEFHRAD